MKKNKEHAFQTPPIALTHLKNGWNKPFVLRKEVAQFSNGLFSSTQICTADHRGQGPDERFYFKSNVAYPIEQLVAWMEQRLTSRTSPAKNK